MGKYSKSALYKRDKPQIKSTIAGGVYHHQAIFKSEMAKNFKFAKKFYDQVEDDKLIINPPTSSGKEVPGPGSYELDV